MFCHLLSTAVNLVLDPLFILVFRMGVGGAAIATVLGNMAGAVYLLHYVFCRSDHLTLSPFPSFRHPASMLKILAIGLPNFISSTLVGLSHAFANQLLVGYGTIVLAGRAAAGKATTLVSTIQMGITIGVQPLLAYNYGAQNLSRIREALRKLTFLTLAVGCSLALVCCLYGKTIVSWFLKELEALTIGQKMVELLVLTGPFLGIYYIASSFLQAIGQAKAASLVSLLRQDFPCASPLHHGSAAGTNGQHLGYHYRGHSRSSSRCCGSFLAVPRYQARVYRIKYYVGSQPTRISKER